MLAALDESLPGIMVFERPGIFVAVDKPHEAWLVFP